MTYKSYLNKLLTFVTNLAESDNYMVEGSYFLHPYLPLLPPDRLEQMLYELLEVAIWQHFLSIALEW